ncbi:hypothetical protein ACFWR6_07040 [Streptomyces griseus]|uniref:hypothetical protein n=1 Tax=Streptomyces griseus TaxID=1911 RepID=UPI003667B68C
MELRTPPPYDEHWEGLELAVDATHRYLTIEQGSNLRLIAVPVGEERAWGYDFAWCYPRDIVAVMASVAAWDSERQDERTGWHKRPTEARQAPRRDEEPEYNRARCAHGCHLDDGCRTLNCRDEIERLRRVSAGSA